MTQTALPIPGANVSTPAVALCEHPGCKRGPKGTAAKAHGDHAGKALCALHLKRARAAAAKPAKAPKAVRAKASKRDLDAAARASVSSVATHHGAFNGFVPAETLALFYKHAGLLSAELVKPALLVDAPEVTISVDKERKTQLGHYKVGRDGLGLRWRVSLNVIHLARPLNDVIRTLLHEILHATQHSHGEVSKVSAHNSQFREWSERLGIPCDAKGVSQGIVPGGLFDEYCKRHNITGTAKVIPPKSAPKAAGSKLKKWSCTGCEKPVNVRVAIEDFDATCNVCGEVFVLTDKNK